MKSDAALDKQDWKILRAISHDARMPVSHIARQVGMSRETVKYRLKKLKSNGFIKYFLTFLDVAKIGYPVWGFMLISFKDLDAKSEDEFDKYIKRNPYVLFAYRALGEWDYGIEFFAKTPQQLYEIQLELKKQFSKIIKDIRTGSIIETVKINYVPQI
ncbi:MAG: AsnC family transcriptional regulator [Candidatus ainarchaeum sp.]|nr:AsnC family transcriptional regulator [Candidatus ainarchaeum sp.]